MKDQHSQAERAVLRAPGPLNEPAGLPGRE
jgi:hypothetical protein